MRKERGITLVALVVTIIVLLILAGVTIAMVLGQNGIFGKAETAKQNTAESQALEKVKLAILELTTEAEGKTTGITPNSIKDKTEGATKVNPENTFPTTITVDGIDIQINDRLQASIGGASGGESGTLPATDETTPYLPDETFSVLETDLAKGLVIEDSDHSQWVWVEVPKSSMSSITNETDTTAIENALITYVSNYREDATSDTWTSDSGMTEEEYNTNKANILKSIYKYGGFWVSRYEVGTDVIRTSENQELTKGLSQQDKYPYLYTNLSKAQQVAKGMAIKNTYHTSLMYGLQWDLICKWIEVKGAKTVEEIKTDSTSWGNYNNANFTVSRGKYSEDHGKTWKEIITTTDKVSSILTTGASERNKVLNIYDLAGNALEATLEKVSTGSIMFRGGWYEQYSGDRLPLAIRFDFMEVLMSSGGNASFHAMLYQM